MECLVVFGPGNIHPLAWLLNRRHRHVWCAVRDTERKAWMAYDWWLGIPDIKAYCHSDFDLATFLRGEGWDVVEIERGDTAAYGPVMANNCVGHVKVICAIRSHAITPHGLYKSLKRRSRKRFNHRMFYVPGLGQMASALGVTPRRGRRNRASATDPATRGNPPPAPSAPDTPAASRSRGESSGGSKIVPAGRTPGGVGRPDTPTLGSAATGRQRIAKLLGG